MSSFPCDIFFAASCSDVSDNIFSGQLLQGFKGMDPSLGTLSIDNNYFYGLPTLIGKGKQFCPDNIPRNLSLEGSALGQIQFVATSRTALEKGHASLRQNCLSTISAQQCGATDQRNQSECRAFCGTTLLDVSQSLLSNSSASSSSATTSINPPCDGHGTCLPLWAYPPGSVPPNAPVFLCNCTKGYYNIIVNGYSTCSLTPPNGDYRNFRSECCRHTEAHSCLGFLPVYW